MEITQPYLSIIAIIAIVLGITNLIFNVILLLRLKAGIHEIKRDYLPRDCAQIVKDMIKQEFNNLTYTPRPIPTRQTKPHNHETSNSENQYTSVENTEDSGSSANTTVPEAHTEAESSNSQPITLYAGTYHGGSFKGVYSVPDEKTIYSICIKYADANEGTICIDHNAYAKVVETPDYLDDACNLHGNGSNIRQLQPGTVIKEGTQWIVKNKIEVELY